MADGKRRQQGWQKGQQQSLSPACSLPPHKARQNCPPGPDAEGHTPCPMALGTQTNKGEQKEDCFETSGQTCRSLETLLSQRQSRGAAERWLSTVS